MHFWRSLIKQSTRAAIIILPIKLSVDSGVWSTNAEKGASLYSRLKSDVIPGTIVYFEEGLDPVLDFSRAQGSGPGIF
uniref:Uncharacterized protein n=1 Tax=Meloidogyne enterolobii TaxID=390850 RepID=A0A6V7V1Z9_MELEN|nr:unnamed protein product [Meloidogyne enterolobii]